MDYDGPVLVSQQSSMEGTVKTALLLNLHSTSTQDAKRLKGLPRKVSSVCRKAE